MNNKGSCQRRSILPSVHSTETVPHFSNHHCYSVRVHQELLIWPKIILTKSEKTTSSWLILLPSIQFRNSEIILNAVSASHGLEKCWTDRNRGKKDGKCAWKLNNTNTRRNPLTFRLYKVSKYAICPILFFCERRRGLHFSGNRTKCHLVVN